jgi:hypothetical protein
MNVAHLPRRARVVRFRRARPYQALLRTRQCLGGENGPGTGKGLGHKLQVFLGPAASA